MERTNYPALFGTARAHVDMAHMDLRIAMELFGYQMSDELKQFLTETLDRLNKGIAKVETRV
jgi:hypothetical protein